ncbi:uncharacterized protein BN783_00538 [Odoribacter sp. CAG:788]|nr:uncharacterized protein BN783_00538 [Odoribacter sp. CAG:788]
MSYRILYPRRYRPGRRVAPVRKLCQYRICIHYRTVRVVKYKLAVSGGRRVIHQARRLVCRVIEIIDTEPAGHDAGDSFVLIRTYLPVKRKYDPEPRVFRPVLVRRIHAPGIFQQAIVYPQVQIAVIDVQAYDLPVVHVTFFTPPFPEISPYEAAHVLYFVLTVFRVAEILFYRFLRSLGLRQRVNYILPRCPFVLPFCRPSGAGGGYIECYIIL